MKADDSSGGCQFQPIPYPLQLVHKQKTVKLAYTRFSRLDMVKIPTIGETIGSPKQWGYRTKITPHFDALPKAIRAKYEEKQKQKEDIRKMNGKSGDGAEEEGMNGEVVNDEGDKAPEGNENAGDGMKEWEVRIGFERKGRPGVMDIEVSHLHTISLLLPPF